MLIRHSSFLAKVGVKARAPRSVLVRTSHTVTARQEDDEIPTEIFQLSNGDKIAYKRTKGSNLPGVIFLPGLLANMNGEKAKILERYCGIYDHPFIRFDYRGLGQSTGNFKDATSAMWLEDAFTVLDSLTNPGDPQVLVGSSMGGIMMMHLAIRRPERIQGLVGITLPYDFDQRLDESLTKEDKKILAKGGGIPSGRGDFMYTQSFVNSAQSLCFSNHAQFPISCPVRLVHGMKDTEVPWELSAKAVSLFASTDVQLILSKSADHRFSKQQDLQILVNTVDQLLKQCQLATE